MIGECIEVPDMDAPTENADKTTLQCPPSKKLKQARLPFKMLVSKTTLNPPSASIGKKRKLSDQEVPLSKLPKSVKTDEKKSKNKEASNIATEENEVSSSSETEKHYEAEHSEIKLSKNNKSGLIETFFNKCQSKNDIVHSTSDVVDLTGPEEKSCEVNSKAGTHDEVAPQLKNPEEKENINENAVKSAAEFQDTNEINETGVFTTPNSKSAMKNLDSQEESKTPATEGAAESPENSLSKPATASTSVMSSPVTPVSSRNLTPVNPATPLGSVTPVSSRNLTPVNPATPLGSVTPVSSKKVTPVITSPALTSPDSSGALDHSFTASTPGSAPPKRNVSSTKKADREAERKRKQEERELERQQKLKQKEEEKAEKERIKKEEKEKKEAEKEEARLKKEKEKMEKKEQQEKEKMEKLKQKEEEKKRKQEIIDAKNEEKKLKEEEKRKKEEEKKKKEEEKLKEEEEKKRKKQKEQNFLQSFFIKSAKTAQVEKSENVNAGPFMQFEVKKEMRLAPTIRREPIDMSFVDDLMTEQNCEKLYLSELREGKTKGTSEQTWPIENKEEDAVEVIEAEGGGEVIKKRFMKAKFLKFAENTRPAFYGTWRKKSTKLSAKNPFKTDKDLFDYEVDSDEEWEEEEPGESLSHSEGEDEDGDANGGDEEEEDGFFVPHGYLSEDEGCEEDEELTPEKMKARQLAKAEQWESQMKEKCKVLKPVCIGCVWSGDKNSEELLKTLLKYQVAALVSTPIHTTFSKKPEESNTPGAEKKSSSASKNKNNHVLKRPVPEEAMPDLIRLVHGNVHSIQKLIREFKQFWQVKCQQSQSEENVKAKEGETDKDNTEEMEVEQPKKTGESPNAKNGFISKRQLDIKIREIADYKKQEGFKKKCWYVNQALLEKHKLMSLPVPCEWEYLIKLNKKEATEDKEPGQVMTPGGIAQFTVAVSPGEALRTATNPRGSPCTPGTDSLPLAKLSPVSPLLSSEATSSQCLKGGLNTNDVLVPASSLSTPERTHGNSRFANTASTPVGQCGIAKTATQENRADLTPNNTSISTPANKSSEPRMKTTPHRSITDFMKAVSPSVLFERNKGNIESANNQAAATHVGSSTVQQDEVQPMDVDLPSNTVAVPKQGDDIMIIDEVLPGKS